MAVTLDSALPVALPFVLTGTTSTATAQHTAYGKITAATQASGVISQ